jgi:hypothetical protein
MGCEGYGWVHGSFIKDTIGAGGGEAKATSNLNLFDDVIMDLVASIDLLSFECEYCKVHKVM